MVSEYKLGYDIDIGKDKQPYKAIAFILGEKS